MLNQSNKIIVCQTEVGFVFFPRSANGLPDVRFVHIHGMPTNTITCISCQTTCITSHPAKMLHTLVSATVSIFLDIIFLTPKNTPWLALVWIILIDIMTLCFCVPCWWLDNLRWYLNHHYHEYAISPCTHHAYNVSLTHCGLVTPYGDTDLGQHWLR